MFAFDITPLDGPAGFDGDPPVEDREKEAEEMATETGDTE